MSTEPLAAVKPGEFRNGVVTAVTPFGAFVDIGGVIGLARREELSWRPVEDARDLISVGDEVNVQVLEVDLDGERMVLSAKAAQVDPWQAFARDHGIGDTVRGQVIQVVESVPRVIVDDAIEGTARPAQAFSGEVTGLAGRYVLLELTELYPETRYVSFSLVGLG